MIPYAIRETARHPERRPIKANRRIILTGLLLAVVLAASLGLRLVTVAFPFVTGRDDTLLALTAIPHRFSEPDRIGIEQPFLLDGQTAATGEPIDPVANLLVGLSYLLFGVGEWQARLPAIGCGLAAVLALFGLVRRLAGAREGLWAAAAFGLAPLSVAGSKVVAPEAIGWMAMFLACHCQLRAEAKGGWGSRIGAAALAAVAVLACHELLLFLVLLSFWAVAHRPRPAVAVTYLAAIGATGLCYSIIPGMREAFLSAVRWHEPPPFAWDRLASSGGWLSLGLAALGMIGLLAYSKRSKGLPLLVVGLAVVTVGGLALFSARWATDKAALIMVVPAATLLIGHGLSRLWALPLPFVGRGLALLALTALAALSALGPNGWEPTPVDTYPLQIGDWLSGEEGSFMIRLGQNASLQREAATIGFYAKRPLTDGRFAESDIDEATADWLLISPEVQPQVPPTIYVRDERLEKPSGSGSTDRRTQLWRRTDRN